MVAYVGSVVDEVKFFFEYVCDMYGSINGS